MTERQAPPDNTSVFDRALVLRRRARVNGEDHFLLPRCAQDAAERILDVNRTFQHALFLGPPSFAKRVLDCLPEGKIITVTIAPTSIDEERLPYAAPEFDLIVSGLTLHSVNDLPGALVQTLRALKPDGLFIGALFGGNTLTELRQVLYQSDEAVCGGITPRVSPMADFQQLASLMQRAGFALPVVDTDRVTVSYKNPMRLFADLKAMGETNALTARSRKPVSKRFFIKACEIYLEQFANAQGKAIASFDILWLTGWAKHDSQQKPLRPGSAKMRLAEALGVKEGKL